MKIPPARSLLMSGALLFASVCSLQAQLVVKLSPQTVAEFERYANKVEAQLNERWSGGKNFLVLDDNPNKKTKVLAGELFIKSMSGDHPVAVTDGLIHDWLGAVFIPHATPEHVISLLEDFNRHKDIYPEVTQSKTLAHNGSTVTGYWRLQQKSGIVPIILDVTEEATYKQVSHEKWKGLTYAKKIVETDTSLFFRGKKYPPGEGHGYLWRLYGYWSLEAAQGGTLAECRTLSLSRDIPQGLNWAVGPYVEKQPRTSLASLLTNTRKAAE